jgi:hypothetical protein
VHLDLVHAGTVSVSAASRCRWCDLEVRHPDRAGAALALELLQHLPGRDVVAVVAGRQRPVDQEQVDVAEVEGGERRIEGAAGVVRPVGVCC